MKKEIRIFFTALMFYTRIPCPSWVNHSEEYLNLSNRYFPLIGWIVGGIGVLVLYISHLVLPVSVSVILSIAATILTTGAFHEDGFADVCDGFGGGWTNEKILEIMKDSRIGAYGTIGIILLLILKTTLLIELININIWTGIKALILSHALSRCVAISMVFTHQYSQHDALTKVKPLAKKLDTHNLLICILWVIPALLIFQNLLVLVVIIPAYLSKMYLAKYFTKWIDGYTGDCLGATQQVSEIITLVSCLILCKFI
jgi:adenosylcobinamide-GDP ribazoletransferase